MSGDERVWTNELLDKPHRTADKADRVRRMFNAIAPRYELVNSVFSFGRDAAWRREAVKLASVRPDDDVLDIACGTGDFARAFASASPRSVVGTDFAHAMLLCATRRAEIAARWCEADAQRLPFRDGAFSITSCAFGVRNFQSLDDGLAEMYRVLRPGGRAVILEFTTPRNRLARALNGLYSNRFMPVAASWLARDRSGAYRYLPQSVVSFLDAEQMAQRLRAAGFATVNARPMTMGIVTIYVARKER